MNYKASFKLDDKAKKIMRLVLLGLSYAIVLSLGLFLVIKGTFEYVRDSEQQQIVCAMRALEEHDVKKAETLFFLAKNNDSLEALPYLSWINAKKGNFDKALYYIREAVDHNNADSCYEILGDLALLGYGKATGAGAALFYFDEALKGYTSSDLKIYNPLKQMYENAFPLCRSYEDLKRLVYEGLKVGSGRAYLYNGDFNFLGLEVDPSPHEAYKNYEQALKRGESEALTRLAGLTWYGYGVKQDYLQAIKLYQEASNAGNMAAEYCLGLISLRTSLKGNYDDALKHFRTAARRGYAPAMTAVAILALNHDKNSKRINKAAEDLFYQAYIKGDHTGGLFYSLMQFCGVDGVPNEEKGLEVLVGLDKLNCQVVKDIMSFLSHLNSQAQYKKYFYQLLTLCNEQLMGRINFKEGAPEINGYNIKKIENHNQITLNMNKSEISPNLKKMLSYNCVEHYDNPQLIKINGEYLFFPQMSNVLHFYNPTTGAQAFSPAKVTAINANLPPLPKDYDRFNIDVEAINNYYKLGLRGAH